MIWSFLVFPICANKFMTLWEKCEGWAGGPGYHDERKQCALHSVVPPIPGQTWLTVGAMEGAVLCTT
jgi:hypothetical protein